MKAALLESLAKVLRQSVPLLRLNLLCRACVAMVLFLLSASIGAQTSSEPSSQENSPLSQQVNIAERGRIDMLSAELRDRPDAWQLIANADVQLSAEMRQGLNSGVPLQFILDFRIKRRRAVFPAKTLVAHKQRYILIYYELTRHYRLQSLDSGKSRNFRSLLSALDELGKLSGIVVPRPEDFNPSEGMFAQLNLRLDDKALPLPLQPLFSSRWKLASEDFAWSLN